MSSSTKLTMIFVSLCSLAVCGHALDNSFSSIFKAIASIAPVSINTFNGTATSLECPDMYKATRCLENEVGYILGQIHTTSNFTELHDSFCQSSEVLINCTASYLRECPPSYTMTFELYFGALQLLCSPAGYNDVVDSFTCLDHPSLALQLDQCDQTLAAHENDTYLCSLPDRYIDCFSDATFKICSQQANVHLTTALHRVFLPYKDMVCIDVNITSVFGATDANSTSSNSPALSSSIFTTESNVTASGKYNVTSTKNATEQPMTTLANSSTIDSAAIQQKEDSSSTYNRTTTAPTGEPKEEYGSYNSTTTAASAVPLKESSGSNYTIPTANTTSAKEDYIPTNTTTATTSAALPNVDSGSNYTTAAGIATAPKEAVGSTNSSTSSYTNATTSPDSTAASKEVSGSINTTIDATSTSSYTSATTSTDSTVAPKEPSSYISTTTESPTTSTSTTTSTTTPPTTPVPSPPFQCYECGSGAPGYWQNSACPANGTLRDWAKQTSSCNGPCVATVTRWPLGDVVRGCSKNQIYQFPVPSSGCRKNNDDIVCFCSGNRCNDRDMTAEQAELVKQYKPQA